jgi:hypothetical protein
MSQQNPQLSRFLTGAATAGAAAAGAVAAGNVGLSAPAQAAPAQPAPKNGGGYHLSEHVKRYYQTTLL